MAVDVSPLLYLGFGLLGAGSILVYAWAPAAGSGVFVAITCHCSRPECGGRRLVPVSRLVEFQAVRKEKV
jgi:hypothetical protein